jgi:hypothetical protein
VSKDPRFRGSKKTVRPKIVVGNHLVGKETRREFEPQEGIESK